MRMNSATARYLNRTKTRLDDETERRSNMQARLHALQAEALNVETMLTEQQQRCAHLEATLQQGNAAYSALMRRNVELDKTATKLHATIARQKALLDQHADDLNARSMQRLADAERVWRERLEQEKETLRLAQADVQARLADKEQWFAVRENELVTQVDALQLQLDTRISTGKDLVSELDGLRAHVENLETELLHMRDTRNDEAILLSRKRQVASVSPNIETFVGTR
jgi:chromosome segregation ATPase